MSDIECPYCGLDLDINHDDGQGYAEDERHEQTCEHCDQTFVFTTHVHMTYHPAKAECLNGEAEHKLKPTITVPRKYTRMACGVCGYDRPCTSDELTELGYA